MRYLFLFLEVMFIIVISYCNDVTNSNSTTTLPSTTIQTFTTNTSTTTTYLLPIQNFIGHTNDVYTIAFSPDGSEIASGGTDMTIRVWDVETGIFKKVLNGHTARVNYLEYVPIDSEIISCGEDSKVFLWNLLTDATVLNYIGHSAAVNELHVNSSGTEFITGSDDNTFIRWNKYSGAVLQTIPQTPAPLDFDVRFNWTEIIYSLVNSDTIYYQQINPLNLIDSYMPHAPSDANDVEFLPNGTEFVSIGFDGYVKIIDIATGNEVRTFNLQTYSPGNDPTVIDVSPDGSKIVVGTDNGLIVLLDTNNFSNFILYSSHTQRVIKVLFSPTENKFASSSWDDTVKIWEYIN